MQKELENIMISEEITRIYEENVKRKGAKELFKYITSTDFFDAPASTKFHLSEPGGLARHSLNVYNLLSEKNKRFKLGYSEETMAICGLFHDLCKVGFYRETVELPTDAQLRYLDSLSGTVNTSNMTKGHVSALIDWHKNGRNGDEPVQKKEYVVEETIPIGHGEKSIMLLSRFIELTPEEAMAIRWHMAVFEAGIHFSYPTGFSFNQAVNSCPLVTALIAADMEAANLLEKE